MRIGDFAKLCKTQISVLRHYDKIGLIKPNFIDLFTGYRYYAPEQIKDFELISKFKKLGFSLKDTKKIITLWDKHSQETEKIFDEKIKELEMLISQIKQEKNNLLNSNKENVNMNNSKDLNVNIDDIKFEDDPEAVGKWRIVGEYDTKEDFLSKSEPNKGMYGDKFKEIYFLPNGQGYWIYGGWTKGFIKRWVNGVYILNSYKIEEINEEKYMFIDWRPFNYMNEERETVLVLKQWDNKKYTLREISRIDDINKPFINDKKILGKWKSVAFVENKEEYFDPDYPAEDLFFRNIEFKENGRYTFNGEDTSLYASWTKGYLLSRAGGGTEITAEKYEIKTIDGKECLFIEWKSGDYIWGGWDPKYYVFVRE